MFLRYRLPLLLTTLAVFSNMISIAHAGAGSGGGGDPCEDRIKIIRDDIVEWIHKGGPKGLDLPSGTSVREYSEAMLTEIKTAEIKCVGPGDKDDSVQIAGFPKVCKFNRGKNIHLITCDFLKFNSLGESDQYVLVHHEYAGLAKLEQPTGADSHYQISNQISGYLVDQVVKKLAIKPLFFSENTQCSSIPPNSAPIGTRCKTSVGATFERVSRPGFGEAWQSQDGLIWSEKVATASQQEAMEICEKLSARLPTKEEFTRGGATAIAEVFSEKTKETYWTPLRNPLWGFVYNDRSKEFSESYKGTQYDVRCVTQ